MGTKKILIHKTAYIFRSFLLWLALLFPTGLLIGYMIAPSFRGLAAIYAFYELDQTKKILATPDPHTKRRQVQQFFQQYGIVIDADDVMDVKALKEEKLLTFEPVGCLEHSLIAYVPLKIRWPLYGTQTFEWCLIIKA